MPNEPLQTYRAVEPANWGFGASATLCSQPFVLAHNYVSLTANTGTATGTVLPSTSTGTTNAAIGWDTQAPGNMVKDVSRCLPWLARDFNGIYPVAVPNAYDRILIFPMYTIEGQAATLLAPTTFDAPAFIPFGLLPETRGFTDVNKLNPKIARFPEDLIATLTPPSGSTGHGINLRTNGAWVPLHPYGSNYLSSNQATENTYAASSPSAFARDTAPALGLGYRLPSDVSISTSTGTTMSATNTSHAASNLIVGAGIEYNTIGSKEIVAVPVTHPSSLTWAVTSGTPFRVHWFLMGAFLG
jgi:hypothetical protein